MSNPQYPQGQPPQQPPRPLPPQPKQKPFGWVAMLIATASTLIIGSCTGGLIGSASSIGAPQATVTVPGPTVTVTEKAEQPAEKKEEPAKETTEPAPPAGLGDGTYEVGVDVKPGRYKTVVPDDSRNCYWARLKNDSGELSAIIANENNSPGARVSVTIKKSDKFFSSRGCGDWTKS